ncbi:MAG: hypothetical protein MMC33_004520 [Icmadophila ericetorum]|nr:hypothetical protein [Icmadophila ericetorum]
MPSATYTGPSNVISARSVDAVRPLKVICLGAGVSGILAAIRFPERVKNLDLVIYEKNEEIGGTWFENKYPGCACDIPAHNYQLSFESNTTWTSFYAKAPEILEYWKKVVDKYGVRKYIKLSIKAVEARWDEKTSKWTVKLVNLKTGETFSDSADVLFTGTGTLNEWKMPAIPGLEDYTGKMMHSAVWDADYKYQGKKVAVVGAGSSGIQIVPNIQPDVERLDHYVRGRTWIATTIGMAEVQKRNPNGGNFDYTPEEIKAWQDNPESYLVYRKRLEAELQTGHGITQRGSAIQLEIRKLFTQLMTGRLAAKPQVAEHLLPNFPPLCKRLTPGPGYLEALTQQNVDVIPTPIERITPTGILTTDGQHREVDAIICATGFNTSFQGRFPIYGVGGVKLANKWKSFPSTYLSMTTSFFPNFFMSLGPNAGLGWGNLLIVIEGFVEYAAQCMARMQVQNILSMQPKPRAEENFVKFCDAYFAGTVFSEECSSWYKTGGKNGRVSALWPGSGLHAIKALKEPRWEDFEYTYVDGNELGWLGDGSAVADVGEEDESGKWYYLEGGNMLHEPLAEKMVVGANE